MNTFSDWLKKRRLIEDNTDFKDPVSNFNFNEPELDYADDQGKVEVELFQTVMRKYPEETMDFLSSLAQKGDNEVGTLLRKLDREGPKLGKKPEHPSDKQEVVPPLADMAHNDTNQ